MSMSSRQDPPTTSCGSMYRGVARTGTSSRPRPCERGWTKASLAIDPEPSFTIYRLRFTDPAGARRDIAGVLGSLEVVDPEAAGSCPTSGRRHRPRPIAWTSLEPPQPTCPQSGVFRWPEGLTELLKEPGEALGSVTNEGVEHVVERVTDPQRIAAIRECLAADDVLIADGHHRYGISRRYRDEVREATGRTDTPAELTLAFVNELIEEQLSVAAIHRLYADIELADLAEALSAIVRSRSNRAAERRDIAALQKEGFLILVGREAAWRMRARPGRFDGVRALDGGWLETALADVPLTVTYQHGLDETLHEVDSGRASAAVLIRPVSVAEIERTAREGLLMPPKSTFFTPKLKTGFVIRSLSD